MTMNKFYTQELTWIEYGTRKERGREYTNIINCVDGAIQGVEDYKNNCKVIVITTDSINNNRRTR